MVYIYEESEGPEAEQGWGMGGCASGGADGPLKMPFSIISLHLRGRCQVLVGQAVKQTTLENNFLRSS